LDWALTRTRVRLLLEIVLELRAAVAPVAQSKLGGRRYCKKQNEMIPSQITSPCHHGGKK